ncbi:MAG: 16S rRNA (guanine(966)-N(2))-methyltransferase RsmD [Chromatiales bacterium]|nr:16S rRNA (guanine(966)-N(2))-methyltransferase RsmD [Chromatiales bacterium]
MPRRQQTRPRRGPPGSVRIIGGSWRGRRIEVLDGAELRPTPDRVRETLFNWLMPVLPGARCLDLYAGTGALGLEALSRGADECWFVERDARVASALEATLLRLIGQGATGAAPARGRVLATDAPRWLDRPPLNTFAVVFLDPPYAASNLGDLCKLVARGWLAPLAWVYLETSRTRELPVLPDGWQLHREAQAGDVRYALATVRSPKP